MPKLATICYIDNGHSLLLLHRNKKPNDVHEGKWIGVGGKLEAGESPEECVIREAKEETGHDWYTYVFRARHFEGQVIDCNEGTLEWVPYDQVLSRPSWEGDHIFLTWILEQKPFFSAKFSYSQDNRLLDHDVIFYNHP